MGIQPIDLQTIYAQMEKVGKQRGAEQSSLIANRERQEEANRLDSEKRVTSVEDTDEINSDKITIKENTRRGGSSGYKRDCKSGKDENDDENQEHGNYIKDPKLGVRIDISG